MRQLLLSIGVFLAFLATARSGEKEAIATAEKAARSWLQLTDNQEYGKSWHQAAPLFRAAITKNDWEKSLVSARRPLGALTSRKLKSAKFTRTLPGAPDGAYVVLQFTSRFAKTASAIETVTPMREPDGSWHVSGYYIR